MRYATSSVKCSDQKFWPFRGKWVDFFVVDCGRDKLNERNIANKSGESHPTSVYDTPLILDVVEFYPKNLLCCITFP